MCSRRVLIPRLRIWRRKRFLVRTLHLRFRKTWKVFLNGHRWVCNAYYRWELVRVYNMFSYKIQFWLTRPHIYTTFMKSFFHFLRQRFDVNFWYLFAVWHNEIPETYLTFFRHFRIIPTSLTPLFTHHLYLYHNWRALFRSTIFLLTYPRKIPFHFIRWSSRSNKPILALQTRSYRMIIHLYSGLFLKFFEKRKSLRKSKLITITMFRYFNILLTVSPLRNFSIILKGATPFVYELLRSLRISAHDSQERKTDVLMAMLAMSSKRPIHFLYLILLHNQSYCFNRLRSCGRIKRKIRRQLVRKNSIVDY